MLSLASNWFRKLVSLVVFLVASACFSQAAVGSPQCGVPAYGPRRAGAAALAAGLGLPAIFAGDARLNLQAEINNLGPTGGPSVGPGHGFSGSVYGAWSRYGYRVDWFDVIPGGSVCNNYPGYWNLSLSYAHALIRSGPVELMASVGGGIGGLPHNATTLSAGATLGYRLSDALSLSTRVRYLPAFPTVREVSEEGSSRKYGTEHAIRGRTRLQWRLHPALQPHVSFLAGLHDAPGANTRSDRSTDRGGFGVYVGGMLGVESRWGWAD